MDECVMSGSRYGTSSEIMIRKAIRNREIDICHEVTLTRLISLIGDARTILHPGLPSEFGLTQDGRTAARC